MGTKAGNGTDWLLGVDRASVVLFKDEAKAQHTREHPAVIFVNINGRSDNEELPSKKSIGVLINCWVSMVLNHMMIGIL